MEITMRPVVDEQPSVDGAGRGARPYPAEQSQYKQPRYWKDRKGTPPPLQADGKNARPDRSAPRNGVCGKGGEKPRARRLRQLLGRAVLGPDRQHLGHLADVVVGRSRDRLGTLVSGVIIDSGGKRFFAPAAAVQGWECSHLTLTVLPHLSCRYGEGIRLAAEVLGRPVPTDTGRGSRVTDLLLRPTPDGWSAEAADTHGTAHRLLGRPHRLIGWKELVARRALIETSAAGP